MRKYIGKIICIILIFPFIFVGNAYAKRQSTTFIPDNYKMVLMADSMVGICKNETTVLKATPIVKNSVFMIPVRFFFEGFDYNIEYSDKTYTIFGNTSLKLSENSKEIVLNNETKTLKENVLNIDGNLYISEDICDYLNLKYKYSPNGLFVIFDGEYNVQKEQDLIKLQGIYMSPNGKNSGNATVNAPTNNMENAKEIAKERMLLYGELYPVNIFVKGGEYKFSATVDFDASSFGKEETKGVNIVGYGKDEVIFSGATKLNPNEFTPVTDAKILSRLPKAGRGRVAYMDLSKQGIDGLSKNDVSFPYVYVDNNQQLNARWPNFDYVKVKSVPVVGEFTFEEVNPKRWTQANDLRINGFFGADYFFGTSRVSGVDAEAMRIKTISRHFDIKRAGARWYAKNLLEEIDIPGEWFVDRDTQILYFYPPYNLKNSELEMTTFQDKPMFTFNENKKISTSGITITKIGGTAINAMKVNGLSISNCKFSFIQGSYAINTSGYNILIDGNDCFNCGGGFVNGVCGDLNTLKDGNMVISNNRITGCGFDPYYINAVVMGGENSPSRYGSVGAVIKNNIMQDCTTVYAISMPGVNTKVLNNEIFNQSKQIDDGGTIYFGRSHSLYGVEVAYNYIHDLNREHFFCGLYNDDGYSGSSWHHNVLYNMNRPFIIGLGMNMNFNYNLAIDCVNGGAIGSRMTWGEKTYGENGTLINEVRNVVSNYEVYNEKFSQLKESLERRPYAAPWNTVHIGNVDINTGSGAAWAMGEVVQYGAKTITKDGKEKNIEGLNATSAGNPYFPYDEKFFIDSNNQNWGIKPDSEVAKKVPELLDIKMEEIGISKGYENLLESDDKFKLKFPYNGQTSVQTRGLSFYWDRLKGATKYKLVVATDPELENVVFEKDYLENGDNNFAIVDTLSLDTVYYWKVYGYGISKQNTFMMPSYGATYGFRTASKNELEKENLKLAIDTLKDLSVNIKKGNYKYDKEFITELEALIEKSSAIYKNSNKQEELDEKEEEIYNLIKRSPFYLEVNFKTPNFLLNDKTQWEDGGGKVTYDGTTVTYSSEEGKRANATVDTDTADSVICFRMKLDTIGDGGAYQGFDFKMDKNSQSYLVIFKESIIEFQKEGKFLMELPNYKIKADEWYDVEAGGVNTPNGVLQFLRIDGDVIFAAIDQTPTQVRDGGKFRLRKNATGSMHIRPMEKIPDSSSLIADIYKSMSNPYNEKQLACSLKGAFDAIEMDSAIYSCVDKEELAKRLYPIIKSGEAKIEGTDFRNFKEIVKNYTVLEAYNQGKGNSVFRNNVVLLYPEIIQFEKIDENGVNIYKFSQTRLKDSDKNIINLNTLNSNCANFDELRKKYAISAFTRSMNACGSSFAADSSYMYELLTKENMSFLGFNIDDYFALSNTQKEYVHNIIGRNGVSDTRTLEEIIAEIHDTVKKAK